MSGDRERLRKTFDSAAASYHHARPDYPGELYDDVERLARLGPDSKLIEVGCATGKATVPLARRGYAITCVELGPDLAAEARRNLAGFPRVSVVEHAFESWRPSGPADADLVFAANAWHWVDPALRYEKAAEFLRPGGHLAFWGAAHVFPPDGDPFFHQLQEVYDEIGEGLPSDAVFPRPGELPDERGEILASGWFTDVVIRQYDWETSYTAAAYIALLDTFSGHIAMTPARRDRLYSEIRRRLGERPDGRLRRHWGAALHVARRLEGRLPAIGP